MKFGRNVLRVKTHALTGDVNESMTSYFKMAVMTSACRLLLHMQQRPPAARELARHVWRHWFVVCATVSDARTFVLFMKALKTSTSFDYKCRETKTQPRYENRSVWDIYYSRWPVSAYVVLSSVVSLGSVHWPITHFAKQKRRWSSVSRFSAANFKCVQIER